MIPEPEQHPARAEQHRLGAALRRSTLDGPNRLIMWTFADQVADATEAGTGSGLSMDAIAEQTGLPHYVVARQVAALIDAGWITRDNSGNWLPTVPAAAGTST